MSGPQPEGHRRQEVAGSPRRGPSLQGQGRAHCGGFPASFLFQLRLLSVEGNRTTEVTFPGSRGPYVPAQVSQP